MKAALDSSAIVAIIYREPGFQSLVNFIRNSRIILGAPVFVECARVLDARSPEIFEYRLTEFLQEYEVQIVDFDFQASTFARLALVRYGRGSGHPAKLNFGDGLSYAIAKRYRANLVYVGNDFDQTDLAA